MRRRAGRRVKQNPILRRFEYCDDTMCDDLYDHGEIVAGGGALFYYDCVGELAPTRLRS